MIGLDSNVLLRLLLEDDPEQLRRARDLVLARCSADHPGFVNAVVLCETLWVLQRAYRVERARVAGMLQALLDSEDLVIEHAGDVRVALDDYRAGKLDLADVLIGAINRHRGCSGTATFDRKASDLQGFFAV
jgi:predicted nucleic-acid-binding protein